MKTKILIPDYSTPFIEKSTNISIPFIIYLFFAKVLNPIIEGVQYEDFSLSIFSLIFFGGIGGIIFIIRSIIRSKRYDKIEISENNVIFFKNNYAIVEMPLNEIEIYREHNRLHGSPISLKTKNDAVDLRPITNCGKLI